MMNQANEMVDECIALADQMPDAEPWIDRVTRAAGAGMACWHDGEAFVAVTGIGADGVSPMASEVQ